RARASRPLSPASRRRARYPSFPRSGCTASSAGRARRACEGTSLREIALAEGEDRAGDHEPLDLARALVDLRDLGVAVEALHRELLRVAVAAEDLDRLGSLPPRHLRCEQLCLRAFLGMRSALLLQPRGPVDEQAGGVDLRRHVG